MFSGVFLYCCLFLSNININRGTCQIPLLTHLIFQETLVGLLHVLRQVGKINKRRNLCIRQLRNILNLDILTFVCIFVVRFSYTLRASSSTFKIRCLVNAEANIIGKSTKGAKRERTASSNVFCTFTDLSSTRSHLFITTTNPF